LKLTKDKSESGNGHQASGIRHRASGIWYQASCLTPVASRPSPHAVLLSNGHQAPGVGHQVLGLNLSLCLSPAALHLLPVARRLYINKKECPSALRFF